MDPPVGIRNSSVKDRVKINSRQVSQIYTLTIHQLHNFKRFKGMKLFWQFRRSQINRIKLNLHEVLSWKCKSNPSPSFITWKHQAKNGKGCKIQFKNNMENKIYQLEKMQIYINDELFKSDIAVSRNLELTRDNQSKR